MNDLKNFKNETTISSKQIAEFTGKKHFHVMESIRTMAPAWESLGQSKFRFANYIDDQGKERPMYQLNRNEFMYIITKFDDLSRAKLVIKFSELESEKTRIGSPFQPAKPGDQFMNRSDEANNDLIDSNPKLIIKDLVNRIKYLEGALNELQTAKFKAEFENKTLPAPTFYYTVSEYNKRFMKIHKLTYEISGLIGSICSKYCKQHEIKKGGAGSPYSYPAEVLDYAFDVYLNNPKALPAPAQAPKTQMIIKKRGDADQLSLAM